MNVRFLLCGILTALLWTTDNVESTLLTTTLLTGLMGGFLIGRLNLGTFLGLLSTNGTGTDTSLPTIPSVNFPSILSALPTVIPREANSNPGGLTLLANVITSTVSPPVLAATQTYYSLPVTAAPNVPYIYTYNYPQAYSYATSAPSSTPQTSPAVKLSVFPVKQVDTPISLDDRVRDRFIRQLAIMDPLNCLPKIFCEVTADPYAATLSMDHGTITNVGPMRQPSLTQEDVVAYEYHLHRQREQTTTTPKPTTTSTTTTTTAAPQNDEEADSQSASEEDDLSAESDSEEDDDSFEQYRKEQEHKIQMQALEEMVDETEDPQTYMYILRDKKRRKTAMSKYKKKYKKKSPSLSGATGFRHEDLISDAEIEPLGLSPLYDTPDYNEELPFLNRRMSAGSPGPPLPMSPPMMFPPMGPLVSRSTEAPMHDMFADDPFFDGFSTASGRRTRLYGLGGRDQRKRVKRQVVTKENLMKKYRVAFMVAEKYRSPDMCNKVFPSCPYRANTILSVVNRLESGLLPFQLPLHQKNDFSNDNIATFKNTLQAIERLNKATLAAQSRGEQINIDKVTELAASVTSNIDANTSQSIVNEFQQVVSKIKKDKLKEKKKNKRKKSNKKRNKYDAVHYYNKAQMETLKPKERVKTSGEYQVRKAVGHHDDELQTQTKLGDLPSFKQTYKEMFNRTKVKKRQHKPNTQTTVKTTAVTSHLKTKHESRPVKKFSEGDEDDEKDARDSEDAINVSIGRSP